MKRRPSISAYGCCPRTVWDPIVSIVQSTLSSWHVNVMSAPPHRKSDQSDNHQDPPWERPAVQVCLQPPRRFVFVTVACVNHGNQPQRFHWAGRRNHHANFILSGQVRYHDHDHRLHHLGPGDCYQNGPERQGWLESIGEEPFIEFYLVLDQRLAASFEYLGIIPAADVIHGGDQHLFTRHFERLEDLVRHGERLPRSTLCSRLAVLLDDCFRDLIASSRRRQTHADTVAHAAEFLQQVEWDRRPLPELAAQLGVSYPTLRRAFSAIEGMSLVHYRLIARLQRAARLLLDGASVEQAATATGYAEPFTFSQQFKKIYDIAPREYQRRYGRV